MKIRVTFKTPDAVDNAVEEAVEGVLAGADMDDDEADGAFEVLRDGATQAVAKWVRYGECVTVEFDTEAGTATVLPQ